LVDFIKPSQQLTGANNFDFNTNNLREAYKDIRSNGIIINRINYVDIYILWISLSVGRRVDKIRFDLLGNLFHHVL